MEGRALFSSCATRGNVLRILYVASAVEVNGTSGGSTHVQEVACGLTSLGHEVMVLARQVSGQNLSRLECGAGFQRLSLPKELALLGRTQILKAFRAFKADVVMERFYNFAGGGIWLAHRQGLPCLLEVNAPMVDPPGALKSKLDRLMFGLMRRWAVRQANWASAIVTPLASTVPVEVARDKICELPWGANVQRFTPDLRDSPRAMPDALAQEFGLQSKGQVVVFLGSFRAWHGVRHFAEAARAMVASGSNMSFLAVGGGPELEPVKEAVSRWDLPQGRLIFTGSQPHDKIPDILALADIGVAPFHLDVYPPLKIFGFYWSPLKVFEYMASGLPVVTIDVRPLNTIVRHEQEGLLYTSGDVNGLVNALRRLETDPGLVVKLGTNARTRVVQNYSWERHCQELDLLLRSIAGA